MHIQRIAVVGFSVVLGLGNCGCSDRNVDQGWASPRPLGKEIASYTPPLQPTTAPATILEVKEPKGPLTLSQALALSLMKNPNLASFAWEVRAKEAQTLQASLPPNPELSVEVEDIRLSSSKEKTTRKRITASSEETVEVEHETETASGPPSGLEGAQYTIALSQVIEMGGKRAKRTQVAAWEQKLASWDYEVARLDILTDVTKGFVDVVSAQQRVALAQELVGLAERSLQTVAERVKAGKVSPMEESKARVALATSRIDLKQAHRRLEAARKRLAYLWGANRPTFDQVLGDLLAVREIPSEDDVLALISENPDLVRWADEMEQRQAAVTLAKAKGIPDLTVSGGYRYIGADKENALVFGVSAPLPVFDRNQGGIQEAKYRFSKALEDREAARVRVQTVLAEGYQALSSAYIEATTLRQEVLPQAENAFKASTEGFQRGKFGYLEVLDAQRTLFEVRDRYIETLASYHKSVADVERLIGTPLISLNGNQMRKERK